MEYIREAFYAIIKLLEIGILVCVFLISRYAAKKAKGYTNKSLYIYATLIILFYLTLHALTLGTENSNDPYDFGNQESTTYYTPTTKQQIKFGIKWVILTICPAYIGINLGIKQRLREELIQSIRNS